MKIASVATALLTLLSHTALAQEDPSPAMTAASAYMDAVFPKLCHDRADLRAGGNRIDDKEFSFAYRDERLEDSEADFTYRLFQMHCYLGAYNSGSVFLKQDETGDFSVVSLAMPSVVYDYADPGKGARMRTPPSIAGYRAVAIVENAEFDPATRTIRARSSWRGMGDAWDESRWTEMKGQFILTRFEVDPTFDDETGAPAQQPLSYLLIGKP